MPTTRIPYGVLDGRYVNAAGDTMLGELTLADAPTLDLHAATKKYVDDAVGVGGHTHALDAGATDVTATAAEVNLLDLSGLSIGQVLRATGAASAAWGSIQAGDLPAGIDAAKIADGSISNTEYQYLNGVTSAIQTQLDAKAADSIVLKKDGSVALTANWDIGDNRKILADGVRARDAAGLELYDDGGNGIFIQDGGRVGIGTNQPPTSLTIKMPNGTVSEGSVFPFRCICGSGENAGMIFERSDASKFLSLFTGGGAAIGFTDDATKLSIGTYTYANRFSTGWPTTEILALYPAGNVNVASGNLGIGIESPGSKLHIYKAITHTYPTPGITKGSVHVAPSTVTDDDSVSITFGSGSGGQANNAQAGLYVQSSGAYGTKMYFATTNNFGVGSQVRIMIDPAGKVGIGTTSPSQALEVAGSAVIGAHDSYHRLYVSRFSSSGYSFIAAGDIDRDMGVGLAFQYRNVNGSLATGLTIDSDGKLGIGIAPPAGPARRLEIIDASTSQLRLTQMADTNYVDFLTNVNGNLTITPSGSKVLMAKALEIDGEFDHDGSTFGVFGVTPAIRTAPYTVTNAITDRSFDADNTTVAELADVVATIINDLKTYGFFQ